MKRVIYRNIAIVSAIFIVSFSIMLVVNYFQVRGATPLGTEVMEVLKQLNDVNASNSDLQEQIRQLDLLARKAYFVQQDRLINGVYILLCMLAVFLLCARGYFEGYKDIPDKEIDPVDEWAIKTKARKYVLWGTTGLAATALVFVVMSTPHLKAEQTAVEQPETVGSTEFTDNAFESETLGNEVEVAENTETSESISEDTETAADTETAPQPATSRVNHNGFRGNNSTGHSSARNIPVKWDLAARTNIAWKIAVPREGSSSPVINGNRVFITGADAEARELFCYDLNTGNLLWRLAATNIPGSPQQMPEVSSQYHVTLADATVATNGTHVCAIFATGDLICADMNGNRVWAQNLGVPDNHYGYVSSLLMFGNMLYVQYDNRVNPRVIAYDIATGAERWNKSRRERITWASPIIAHTANNTPILVLMGQPNMIAYNPNNGDELWRVQFLTGEVAASATSVNGIVYAASDFSKLIAVNAADGTVLWDDNFHLPELSSPVATRDNVYIATSYGVFAAFDTQKGEMRKEHELSTSEFYSSPMIADGKIYLFDTKGKVYILSTDNDFNLLDSFETGEETIATPAFTDGKIVVRTEKNLYCVAVR